MDIHDRSRSEVAAWVRDMMQIRATSYKINDDNYTIMIPLFLSLVEASVWRWGSNNILMDIKRAMNTTEKLGQAKGTLSTLSSVTVFPS